MCSADENVQMSQSPDFLLEGDKLSISCAVMYSGYLAPYFVWYPPPVTRPLVVDTGSSINSTIQVIAPSFPGSVQSRTCYVYFSGSVFPSAANQTSTIVETSGKLIRASFISLYEVSHECCFNASLISWRQLVEFRWTYNSNKDNCALQQ